jgi:hypothetical protein
VTNLQLALSIGIPTLAVLITFVHNSARFNSIEQRLTTMQAGLEARLATLEADMRQFYHLTGKMEGRIDSLENK